jgi:hypothetical protein
MRRPLKELSDELSVRRNAEGIDWQPSYQVLGLADGVDCNLQVVFYFCL